MPELWSEPERNSSGFDFINDCFFSGCFGFLLVSFIMVFPILSVLYLVYFYK